MRVYTLIVIVIITISACAKKEGVCIKSAGKDSVKEIPLDFFNKLEVYDKIDVEIYRSKESKAVLYSGANIIDGIGFSINNNTLILEDNNRCHWLRNLKQKPKVKLYLDSLESLIFMGAGNLTCYDTIPSKVLYIEAWEGSGDIQYITNSQNLYLKSHTGISHFNVKGSCDFLFLFNSTYAQFKTKGLISNETHVSASGNGDMEIFANTKISIDQTGYSTIYYNASVQELNILNEGVGEIIPY